MAGAQITTAVTAVEGQRLGYNGISFTDMGNGASAPSIAAGSKIEIGGALFTFASDEDIDSTTQWAGIGASTQVYCYCSVSGATVTAILATTLPTWDDAKQGFYNGENRCYGSIYKDSGGNYDDRSIWLNNGLGISHAGVHIGGPARYDNSATYNVYIRVYPQVYFVYDSIGYLGLTGAQFLASKGIRPTNSFIETAGKTQNEWYDTFSPYITGATDVLLVTGSFKYNADGSVVIVNKIGYKDADELYVYGMALTWDGDGLTGCTATTYTVQNGSATAFSDEVSISW